MAGWCSIDCNDRCNHLEMIDLWSSTTVECRLAHFQFEHFKIFKFFQLLHHFAFSTAHQDTSPEDYFSEIRAHIEAQNNCSSNNLDSSPFGRMELSFESVLSVVPKTKSSAPNEEEAALVVFFADGYREIKAKELIKEILIHKPVSFFGRKPFYVVSDRFWI